MCPVDFEHLKYPNCFEFERRFERADYLQFERRFERVDYLQFERRFERVDYLYYFEFVLQIDNLNLELRRVLAKSFVLVNPAV